MKLEIKVGQAHVRGRRILPDYPPWSWYHVQYCRAYRKGVQLWTRAIKMMRLGDPFALPASEKCRSA